MFEYVESQKSDFLVLDLKGVLDLFAAAEFRRFLDGRMKEHNRLALVLKDVTHIDSSGMALLIAAQRSYKGRSGARFVLVSASTEIRSLFRLMFIEKLFEFVDTIPAGATVES
ncbi:MAG: STAS domain-containing protein [Spirochaetales bacterium]|nr:STAS domain-containing protein [Spirochaetales bacterium]